MIDNRTLESLYLAHIVKLRAFLDHMFLAVRLRVIWLTRRFLRIISIDPGKVIRNPLALLYRIARNLAIDHYRANSPFREKFIELDECRDIASALPDPEQAIAIKWQMELLCRAINELPPKCRI